MAGNPRRVGGRGRRGGGDGRDRGDGQHHGLRPRRHDQRARRLGHGPRIAYHRASGLAFDELRPQAELHRRGEGRGDPASDRPRRPRRSADRRHRMPRRGVGRAARRHRERHICDHEKEGISQGHRMPIDHITIRGAREHNLKNVTLSIPRDKLVVFTGLSGSGKSSLAFDTIYAEGQRRYVESLSAYARQFLGQMDKPDVDFIEGLSPAISIDQKSASRNPRSTVGTITEVYDYLRLLYARAGTPHCPVCGERISRQTPQQIVDQVLAMEEGTRFQLLAPGVRARKGEYVDLFSSLQTQGFSRVRVDGTVHPLTEPPKLKKQEKHTIEVIVDRLTVKESAKRRLTDSVETALGLAGGLVVLDFVDLPEDDPQRERTFSEHLACIDDGLSFEALEPRSFSFNSPFGACPECTGIGTRKEVDPELVVPDPEKSLGQGAVAPWAGSMSNEYFQRLLSGLADQLGFSMDTAWEKLPARVQKA